MSVYTDSYPVYTTIIVALYLCKYDPAKPYLSVMYDFTTDDPNDNTWESNYSAEVIKVLDRVRMPDIMHGTDLAWVLGDNLVDLWSKKLGLTGT